MNNEFSETKEVDNKMNDDIDNNVPDFIQEMEVEVVTDYDEADKTIEEVKTEKEIEKISEFSSEINENIKSTEELKIYQDTSVKEVEVNGRKCLILEEINLKQTDDFGRTNLERMHQGLAPLDKNGDAIELHHIGQDSDAPIAEMSKNDHRGAENYSVLHERQESKIDRNRFNTEKANHWKSRAKEMEGK